MAYNNVTGTNGNNVLFFDGVTRAYSETLVNPYSGYTVTVNGAMNVNNAIYDGLGGTDTLSMTSLGDVLTLVDADGTIMIRNVETFNAGADGDIIILAHSTVDYGNTTIRGSEGADILWANNGNDMLLGGAGDDIVDGGGGNDTLFGDAGNDYLSGGLGVDSLFGGADDDILGYVADSVWSGGYTLASLGSGAIYAAQINLDGKNRSYDTFNGDATDSLSEPTIGTDTLIMTDGDDVLVLSDTVSPGGFYTPRVAYIEIFEAGKGDDVIDLSGGTHISTTIHGGEGDDVLAGSTGNDTITGDDGNDILSGGGGNDTLSGGTGDDAYYYALGDGDDVIAETSGNDSIHFGAGIGFADLSLSVSGQDVLISVGGATITVQNHLAADLSGRVESLVFDDGATFDLSTYGLNEAPVAHDDAFSVDEDTVISGNVLANDTDANGDTLSVDAATIVTAQGGTVVLNTDGTFTYTPAANFHGADSFTYTARDPLGLTASANVALSVLSVNDAPVAVDDAFALYQNGQVSGNIAANDSDLDGDVLSVQAGTFTTALGATIVLDTAGNFTYTPAAGFYGEDSFDYTLVDGAGASDQGTAFFSVDLDPSVSIIGTENGETLTGTDGDDRIFGLGGDDILYGDDGILSGSVLDKDFADTIIMPHLKEGVNITNLRPKGDPALGINDGNLTVDFDATASVTFRKGYAGHDNSFGVFGIAEDGTIVSASMEWKNVKTAGIDIAHDVDLPVGADGGAFGFFIVANGNNVNSGYGSLDVTGEGVLSFVYNYGKADQRAATITDPGNKISLVYDDGVTVKVLKGDVYFTTDRGDSTSVNEDGKTHVVSGLLDDNNQYLDIKSGDVSGKPASITKNDFTITASTGYLCASGTKLGINSGSAGGAQVSGNEAMLIALAQGAEKLTVSLSNISGNGKGIDFKIYLDGSDTPVSYEHVSGSVSGGKLDIVLDADQFGGDVITKIELSSVANSSHGTESFWLDNLYAEIPGGTDTNTLRIGFEDLYNTGDADYEDVLFDLDIKPVTVGDIGGGNDYLDGGAGNDILYGEGGNDILVLGLGADRAYGGEGADTFAVTLIDTLIDRIEDFNAAQGDVINIADVLDGYDPLTDDIANFVRFVQNGADTELQINADGQGSDFAAAALIVGGTDGADIAAMISAGALVTDHSALA